MLIDLVKEQNGARPGTIVLVVAKEQYRTDYDSSEKYVKKQMKVA